MSELFGRMLREARRSAGKTLEELALLLKVSIPYVSEVERGNRAPLSPAKTKEVARFLGVDYAPLLKAAAEARGFFELEDPASMEGRAAGAALMRGWSDFSTEDFQRIQLVVDEILGKRGGRHE